MVVIVSWTTAENSVNVGVGTHVDIVTSFLLRGSLRETEGMDGSQARGGDHEMTERKEDEMCFPGTPAKGRRIRSRQFELQQRR